MNEKDFSGPAFPVPHGVTSGYMASFAGMTLRDYFAAKAMAAYVSSDAWREEMEIAWTAQAAYHFADAMMKAREA